MTQTTLSDSDGAAPLTPDASDLPAEAAELSHEQKVAIDALLRGHGTKRAAHDAMVHRGTVHRWMTTHVGFRRALAAGRSASRVAARTQLLSLVERAAQTVEGAILNGEVQIAMQLLRSLGLLDTVKLSELNPPPTPAPEDEEPTEMPVITDQQPPAPGAPDLR